MKITWLPSIHMHEGVHALSKLTWQYGETKDIDPEETILVRVDSEAFRVRLVDDLLSSPDYVIAENQENPNYVCSVCGLQTRAESFAHKFMPNLAIPYEVDGQRYCPDCFPPYELTPTGISFSKTASPEVNPSE